MRLDTLRSVRVVAISISTKLHLWTMPGMSFLPGQRPWIVQLSSGPVAGSESHNCTCTTCPCVSVQQVFWISEVEHDTGESDGQEGSSAIAEAASSAAAAKKDLNAMISEQRMNFAFTSFDVCYLQCFDLSNSPAPIHPSYISPSPHEPSAPYFERTPITTQSSAPRPSSPGIETGCACAPFASITGLGGARALDTGASESHRTPG